MIDLICFAERLEKGESIRLNRSAIVSCAEQNLSSKIFDSVRREDIENVANIVNLQWYGCSLVEDLMTGDFTLSKADTR